MVSVIIPMFNAGNTIRDCLASVYHSPYKNFEVIVVDDRSSDDSVKIAKQFRCTVIELQENRGPAVARNAGARKAKGEVLLFVDADTQMFPSTIGQAVSSLSQPGIDAVGGIYDKTPLNPGFFAQYYALVKYFVMADKGIERYNVFPSQCAAIKKEVFLALGGFKDLRSGMDIENEEFGMRLARDHAIAINRDFMVKHYFGNFKKLMYIYNHRTYLWVKFRLETRSFEPVPALKGFSFGCIAALAAVSFLACSAFLGSRIFLQLAAVSFTGFLLGYAGLLVLTLREKGLFFFLKSLLATLFFAVIASCAALRALAAQLLKPQKGKNL